MQQVWMLLWRLRWVAIVAFVVYLVWIGSE